MSASDGDTAALDDRLRTELVRFVRRLRADGVGVPGDGALAAAEALAALDSGERATVRAALRATLCGRPDDDGAFERRFPTFWARVRGGSAAYEEGEDGPATLGADGGGVADAPGQTVADEGANVAGASGGDEAGGVGSGDADGPGSAYGRDGERRPVSLGDAADPDVSAAARAFTDAVAALPGRPWSGGNGRPDVRSALRASATGRAPLPLPERERNREVARGVLLVDVSASVLDRIERDLLLAFCREVRARWRRTPVYFFDTALRDASDAFDARSTREAAAALDERGVEWGGGTRIGAAVAALRNGEAVDRRDVVVVVSDGVERGGTEAVREGFVWLARRAQCVLWLNPLAADSRWTPAAPAMRAALPSLDGLYAFADSDDFAALADDLARRGPTLRALDGV